MFHNCSLFDKFLGLILLPKMGMLNNMEKQISLFSVQRLSVTELTRRVRRLLEADPTLEDVWVQGELSNVSRPASGHVYFTLKDAGAALRCVMWKGDAVRMRGVPMQDGLSLEVHGKITVYEPSGQYQLVVDIVRPAGEGALYAEFLRLKAALEAEGLFDGERKREIPLVPRKIGIVTSATGAALRDMLTTLRRRMPLAEVILAPAPVQGVEAPPALVNALETLNRVAQPDVILLARGGGSMEDLWAFNDERVVRAVAASAAPVINGVGHETDFTLCDFAADRRAPTPTAAAEFATPITRADLLEYLAGYAARLQELTEDALAERRAALSEQVGGLRYFSPVRRLQTEAQRLDDYARRVERANTHRLQLAHARLEAFGARLAALNPLAVLARGYAVVTRPDGSLLKHAADANQDDLLRVRLDDGIISARVTEKEISRP
jgi:exodeoxyribonuclease VII large subunit